MESGGAGSAVESSSLSVTGCGGRRASTTVASFSTEARRAVRCPSHVATISTTAAGVRTVVPAVSIGVKLDEAAGTAARIASVDRGGGGPDRRWSSTTVTTREWRCFERSKP